MDLKLRVKKMEEHIPVKDDCKWRERYAQEYVRIERMIEKVYGKKLQLEKEIIAEGIKYLKHWPNEKAFLEHIEKARPEIDELWAKIKSRTV